MPKLDETMTALGCCIGQFPGEEYCKTCPYQPYRFGKCKADAIKDALELMKEQPQIVRCKDCENFIYDNISPNAGSCLSLKLTHSKNWFCANGKKKDE